MRGYLYMARKYQRSQEHLPQIKAMIETGMTQKEVENALGLTGARPVHQLLKRERKKEVQGMPKVRGRKPAKTLQEFKYENNRLKMEKMHSWQRNSRHSRNAVSRPMGIVGCSFGWKTRESIIIRKRYFE